MEPFNTQSSNLCILSTRGEYLLKYYHRPSTELSSVEKTKLNESSYHPLSRIYRRDKACYTTPTLPGGEG